MSFDPTRPLPSQPQWQGQGQQPAPPQPAPPQPAQPQPATPQPAQPQWQAQQPQWQGQQPQWPAQPPEYVDDRQYPGGRPPRRRRRRVRRSFVAVFVIIVLLILLVIGDRVAKAIAENQMASQFTEQGLPVKPSVTIEGFPFLTQLAAKDFKKVDVSASSIPAGPVTITSMKATANGMHINGSWNGATVDQLNATVFVSSGAIAAAGGLDATGVTMKPDGPDRLKITASLGGIINASEDVEFKQTGPQEITVAVVDNGDVLSGVLSQFGSYKIKLPDGVPASLKITGLTLNDQGLTVNAAATNATFTEPAKKSGGS